MAKPTTPQFPTSGGSYERKPTGALDQVEATKAPPPVQVQKPEAPPAAPVKDKE